MATRVSRRLHVSGVFGYQVAAVRNATVTSCRREDDRAAVRQSGPGTEQIAFPVRGALQGIPSRYGLPVLLLSLHFVSVWT